jgi:hypothetical protein
MRSAERSAGPLRWLEAALTGLLPTPPTPVQITKGLSLWLDEKRGSRHDLNSPAGEVESFKGSRIVASKPCAEVAG